MQRFNAPASPSGRLRVASEQGLLDASRSLEMDLENTEFCAGRSLVYLICLH
jgi:hypothetical protein